MPTDWLWYWPPSHSLVCVNCVCTCGGDRVCERVREFVNLEFSSPVSVDQCHIRARYAQILFLVSFLSLFLSQPLIPCTLFHSHFTLPDPP